MDTTAHMAQAETDWERRRQRNEVEFHSFAIGRTESQLNFHLKFDSKSRVLCKCASRSNFAYGTFCHALLAWIRQQCVIYVELVLYSLSLSLSLILFNASFLTFTMLQLNQLQPHASFNLIRRLSCERRLNFVRIFVAPLVAQKKKKKNEFLFIFSAKLTALHFTSVQGRNVRKYETQK